MKFDSSLFNNFLDLLTEKTPETKNDKEIDAKSYIAEIEKKHDLINILLGDEESIIPLLGEDLDFYDIDLLTTPKEMLGLKDIKQEE